MTRRSLFHAVILSGVWRAPRQTESKDPDKSRCATAVRTVLPRRLVSFVLAFSLACFPAVVQLRAQTQPAPVPANPPDSAEPAPTGTVLFSRDANSPGAQPTVSPNPAAPTSAPTQSDPLAVTDAERSALTFTAYDLDVHLAPASAAISVRAGLTIRNDSPAPLAPPHPPDQLLAALGRPLHPQPSQRPDRFPPLRRPPHRHRRRPHRPDDRSRRHPPSSTRSRRVRLAHRALLRRNPALRRTPHAHRRARRSGPRRRLGLHLSLAHRPARIRQRPLASRLRAARLPRRRRTSLPVRRQLPPASTPPQPSASVSPSSTRATRPTPPSSAASASRSPPSATTPTSPRPSLPVSPPPSSTPSRSASARPASSSPTAPPARPERPPTPHLIAAVTDHYDALPCLRRRRRAGRAPPHRLARPAAARHALAHRPPRPALRGRRTPRPSHARRRTRNPRSRARPLPHSRLDSLHPSLDRRGPRPVPLAPLDRAHRWPRRRARRTCRTPPARSPSPNPKCQPTYLGAPFMTVPSS